MVVKKGFLTWRLIFSWVILYTGCFLTNTVNADSVVIHSSMTENSTPGVVQRKAKSLKACAQACTEEKEIKCNFFKFHSGSNTCFMSATDRQNMQSVGSVSASKKHKKDTSKWAEEVDQRLSDLEQQDAELARLKSSIGDIRDELQMLRKGRVSESHRSRAALAAQQEAYSKMNRNLASIRLDGEKIKAAVHALSNMQRILAKKFGGLKNDQDEVKQKVTEVEGTAEEISTLVASLKATDTVLQRELDAVKDGANNLAATFKRHKAKIREDLGKQQMSPTMVKLKHNQGTLATALESVMDKVTSLTGQLPSLENELRDTNKNVANQAMYEHELRSKLITFYRNLVEIKSAVHSILDPRSTMNMERKKSVLKLESDISTLSQRDEDIRTDVSEQRDDLAHLIKDVAHLQLMAQNLQDRLTTVLTASQKFQGDIAELKKNEKQKLSPVKMIAMQKQVLISLNRLKTREAILLKQLNLYRDSVKKIEAKVRKSDTSRSSTEDLVSSLQNRLGRFEKQIQLLFDKTTSLTSKLTRPRTTKGMDKLVRNQEQISDKVEDIVKQLQSVRQRVSLLTMELKQTEKEGQEEKIEMAKDVKARQEEMKEREHMLKEQRRKEKAEEERMLKIKKAQLARQERVEKERMEKEIKREQRKRLKEREETRKQLAIEEKKRRKLQEQAERRLSKGNGSKVLKKKTKVKIKQKKTAKKTKKHPPKKKTITKKQTKPKTKLVMPKHKKKTVIKQHKTVKKNPKRKTKLKTISRKKQKPKMKTRRKQRIISKKKTQKPKPRKKHTKLTMKKRPKPQVLKPKKRRNKRRKFKRRG